VEDQVLRFGQEIVDYLPSLFAGLILVACGWLLGWFVKRLLIQVAVILRLERFLTSFRWGGEFFKADVRYGFYNLIGNFGFFVVFMIFLANAFDAWKLTLLSQLLEDGIYFIPKIIIALLVFGAGWLISAWVSRALLRALRRENIPKETLISSFAKVIVLLFFSAMALFVLDIARIIVIIGFTTVIVTLSILVILVTALGGKEMVQKIIQSMGEK